MMNEIIIDGVNVAECKYFLYRNKEEISERSCGVGLTNCKGQDCTYKQLQRAEAENKLLKSTIKNKNFIAIAEENELLKNLLTQRTNDVVQQAEIIVKLKAQIDSCNDEFGCELMAKYRKALKEIEEIAYTTDFDIVDIQEVVDEVLND